MALLLQHAEIRSTDIVMEIAAGTGYSTAVLAKMASTVVAIEADKVLADRATSNLVESGIDNAAIMTRPLIEGYKKQAPYNVIIISGCVEEVPDSLMSQIADGGNCLPSLEAVETQGRGRSSANLGNRSPRSRFSRLEHRFSQGLRDRRSLPFRPRVAISRFLVGRYDEIKVKNMISNRAASCR